MAQNPSTSIDYGASLDKRLLELDDVDRKIADLMETTKEIIGNLEKDKQISKTKMDESVKKFTRALEEDIYRVVNEQLNYMEQLCVGSEHQGSMFRPQNRHETSKRTLQLLHNELEALVPTKVEVEKEKPAEELDLSDADDDESFEDVLSGASDESQ